jgi:uncharacterized YigZ family protein
MIYVKDKFDAKLEIKKSKFLAYLFPYNLFDSVLNDLKKAHPKARHFVYAYRFLNQYNQIIQNCSDDGEPKGTSGPPVLKVLSGKDIINSGIIIVRYFGGIKLGTGGLVKAYSTSANQVIQIAQFYEYKQLSTQQINIDYKDLSKIEYQIKKLNLTILNKTFGQKVLLKIEGEKDILQKLTQIINKG